jgi:TRAP-type mannitol/chloroaromatic compound transport system permease large subunit
VGAFTFVRQGLPLVAAIAVAAGLLSIAIVERRGWSRRVRVAAVIAVTVGWIALVILGAAFVRTLGQ